jgi:hypothetical protein
MRALQSLFPLVRVAKPWPYLGSWGLRIVLATAWFEASVVLFGHESPIVTTWASHNDDRGGLTTFLPGF